MNDDLFGLLLAVGAFDDPPAGKKEPMRRWGWTGPSMWATSAMVREAEEKPKPEDQGRRDDSGVVLRMLVAVVVAFLLLAYVGSVTR